MPQVLPRLCGMRAVVWEIRRQGTLRGNASRGEGCPAEHAPDGADGVCLGKACAALSPSAVPPPDGLCVRGLVCADPRGRSVLSDIAAVGLGLAKTVSVARGDPGPWGFRLWPRCFPQASGAGQMRPVFGRGPRCSGAMDACGGAHFRGRETGARGAADSARLREALRHAPADCCGNATNDALWAGEG